MSTHPTVRIGLIGCGGRIRGVAKHLLDSPKGGHLAVTAMFDPFPGSIAETQRYLGTNARTYPSAEALVRESDVDWVMIGSWNCHDYDLVNWILGSLPVRAASFGGKDVFRPEYRHLADKLGPDAKGNAPYKLWYDPQDVDPFSAGSSIVDNQVAILEYASGARASFHTNCHAAIIERRMYYLGTAGTLRVDAITGRIETQSVSQTSRPELIDVAASSEGHLGGDTRMASHLADTMLDGAAPLATLEDGLRSAVSCYGVDEALDTGSVVDLHPLWKQVGITP
jgi:predicted dehydrogenase